MFKATILFSAVAETEDVVIEKIVFDLHEEFRREGVGIEVQEIEDADE